MSEKYTATVRCYDGSDDNLVSSRLEEAALVKGIGRIEAIKRFTVQVSLAADAQPQTFGFSREWTIIRLTFHLAAGPLALLKIFFLVSDDDLD